MQFQRFQRSYYPQLPDHPGVYKFLDNHGIIYVGKAKSLRKRVSSYFNKSQDTNRKTLKLVGEIQFIEIVIVDSEFDALLLENSLIKENQPKYNILLKDDKSFPSICISNERFPKIYSTRRIDKSKGEYFGPYTSVKAMNNVIELIRKLYTVRTCNLNLSEKNISSGKFKVCLEYHLGNCKGPCEGNQAEKDYLLDIVQAKEILKGRISIVKQSFLELMKTASEAMNFELAQIYKEKIDYLNRFQSKSLIVPAKISNLDVFTIVNHEQYHYINFLMIMEGAVKVSETVEVKNHLAEPQEDVLTHTMLTLKGKYASKNTEILCNIPLDISSDEFFITVPKIGDKKKLLALSLKNALISKQEKKTAAPIRNSQLPILQELQSTLQLSTLPNHIECFDNSNIQGTNPVASMVCFKEGKASKKDYRKYNIKTVIGPDDFSSMTEVVGRRYSYLQKENLPLPDLIVIDGGKGQLNAAIEALKSLDLYGSIAIVGIAKRLEEIYLPNDPVPVHFNKKSPALLLLQRIRDEAHRFAITFHKQKRSKASFSSELDTIKGIGRVTKDILLTRYGSLNKLKNAELEELRALIGKSKAQIVKSKLS